MREAGISCTKKRPIKSQQVHLMQVKKNKLRAERCNSLSHVRSTTTRSAKSLRKGKKPKKIRRKCATVAPYLASSSLRSSLASTSSFPLSIFDGEGEEVLANELLRLLEAR